MNPSPSLSLLRVVTESHGGFSLHEEQHGWFRRRVFGKFLSLTEGKDHGLDAIILVDRAAQDAVSGRLGFFGEVEDVGVGRGHCLVPSTKVTSRQLLGDILLFVPIHPHHAVIAAITGDVAEVGVQLSVKAGIGGEVKLGTVSRTGNRVCP